MHVQESKAEGKVARIEYDRTKVTPGIVHFGVGGFHRGHQAVAVHRLLQQGLAMDWGICGVGVLEGDMKMRDVLDAQDGVFTVVEKSPDGSQTVQLIGSIVEYLYAPDSIEDVLARLADPATRIVSLTITEGGRVPDEPMFCSGLMCCPVASRGGAVPCERLSAPLCHQLHWQAEAHDC